MTKFEVVAVLPEDAESTLEDLVDIFKSEVNLNLRVVSGTYRILIEKVAGFGGAALTVVIQDDEVCPR